MELIIFKEEDRLEVAKILVKNGYTVSQGKRKKTPTGKSVEYYIMAVLKEDENED